MGKGIGFKVLTKKGLSAPFMKSSVLKAIEMGVIPLKAKLFDMEGERYVVAADLVGEQLDKPAAKPEPAKAEPAKPAKAAAPAPKAKAEPPKKQVKLPKGKQAPKAVTMPKPRKKDAEVDAVTAAADTHVGATSQRISPQDAMEITPEEIAAAAAAAAPKPKSKDATKQINEVGQLTSISEMILLDEDVSQNNDLNELD